MSRHDWIYATPAQEAYIRRLWVQAEVYRTAKWPRTNRRMLKKEASREIAMLLEAIREGKQNEKDQT